MKKTSLKIFMLMTLLCGSFVYNSCIVFANSIYTEQSVGVNDEMEDYIRLAKRSIKNNWYPPVSSFENSAKMSITLDKNGQLLDCHIIESSKNDGFDSSLIDAAKKAKFKPLPESYRKEKAELYLSFSMQRHYVTK